MATLFDTNPAAGTKQIHHYDHSTGSTIIQTIQDVEPYLESLKQIRHATDNHFKDGIRKEGFGHAARIPAVTIEEWLKEGIHVLGPKAREKSNLKRIQAKLNGDFKYLKTTDHRIGLV